MTLDAFGDSFSDLGDQLASNAKASPPQPLEPSLSDAFKTAFEANRRYSVIAASEQNQADFVQQRLDAFAVKTGQTIANPWGVNDSSRPARLDAVRKQFDTYRGQLSEPDAVADPDFTFPSDEDIWRGGIGLARQARQRQAAIEAGPMGPGARIASFGGESAVGLADPLNVVAMSVGTGAGSLAMRALRLGAGFSLQSAISEAATFRQQKEINPEHTIGEALTDVALSFPEGVGFELGGAAVGKLLGAAWRRVRGTPAIDRMPLEVRDGATVAERAADLDAQNPFGGVDGHAAHVDAVAQVENDLLAGRATSVPPSVDDMARARTGEVFVSPQVSPITLVDQHAFRENPDLFQRVSQADQDIVQARQQLSQRLEPEVGGSSFGSLSTRIDDLQSQLDQITGKRRSSPRARDLRKQIEDLKAQNASIDTDAASRNASEVAFLRQRLLEVQNRRALLGPEVRAAREASAQALGIPLDNSMPLDAMPSHSGRVWQAPPEMAAAEKPAKPSRRRGKAPVAEAPVEPEVPAPSDADVAAVRTAASIPDEGDRFVGRQAVRVRYELAERGDLVTSHDADFNVNPAYPADLQPRNRGGIPQRDQVFDIAANMQPERLGPSPEANAGAPIVGPDNVVESGNGRALALGLAYRQGSERAAAYRAFLERIGLDTSGMREPVLIARRTTAMTDAERSAFAHAANGSVALRMTATEQAMSDARHIGADVASLLQPGDIGLARNRDAVRAFIDRLPAGERGSMMTADGKLSAAGTNRIRAALVARAFGDADVVARAFDHADGNIKTIAAALTDAAPEWIKLRVATAAGEVAAGHDITADVMNAVKTIMRARDEGENIGKMLAQGDFFLSDTSALAARLFFKDASFKRFLSKADMGENLSSFARGILDQRGKGADLFGAAPPDTGQVLGNVVRLSDARQAQVDAALKPEAVEKAFADPKVHEAAEAELRRNIEQGKNPKVITEGPDGSVSVSLAEQELHRLDQEIAAAKEIRTCTTPGGEEAEKTG